MRTSLHFQVRKTSAKDSSVVRRASLEASDLCPIESKGERRQRRTLSLFDSRFSEASDFCLIERRKLLAYDLIVVRCVLLGGFSSMLHRKAKALTEDNIIVRWAVLRGFRSVPHQKAKDISKGQYCYWMGGSRRGQLSASSNGERRQQMTSTVVQ